MSDYSEPSPSLPVLTAAQMRFCDEYTMRTYPDAPSRVLMERAARAVVSCVCDRFPADAAVVVLCGAGNNGGDGFAAARFLADDPNRAVSVLYLGRLTASGLPDTDRMSVECARRYRLAVDAGVTVRVLTSESDADAWVSGLPDNTLLIDAVFGIGLDRPVAGLMLYLFGLLRTKRLPTLAVDIPSGIRADTGEVMGAALPCAVTVTMQALKPGLLLYPGAELCGHVVVADIGIDVRGGLASLPAAEQTPARLVGRDELLRVLPPRARRTHKGSYGNLALAVGSRGMAGAAVLSVSAALRSGAGLVTCVTPQANRVILQTAVPEAVLCLYNGRSPDLRALHTRLFHTDGAPAMDGLVIGCGLGAGNASHTVLSSLLDAAAACPSLPVVLDADALNMLAKDPQLWDSGLMSCQDKRVVITPHPAEMSRLSGLPIPQILADLPSAALRFARERGVTVVLKDAHTVIASPDGQLFMSAAGNAGMAKGGSGDVLSGIIGALLVQNRARIGHDLTVAEIAAAGVLLHGLAGDHAAREKGEYGMTASDIVSALPAVTRGLSDSRTVIETI